MLKTNIKKSMIVIIILIFLSNVGPFVTTTKADVIATPSAITTVDTTSPLIIDAGTYNLDTTGTSDCSVQFQKMLDSFPSGSSLQLPKGLYKLSNSVKLKDNMTLIASNDVIINGTGYNTLFSVGNYNNIQGIEFQNCSTAISVFQKQELM